MDKNLRKKFFDSGKTIIFITFVLLCISNVASGASYQTLFPYLIDLPGWSGSEPEGMNMEMSGMTMVNATRSYTKGDKELTAVIMIGNQAFGLNPAAAGGMKVETSQGKMDFKTIDGFQVQTVYDKEDNSGAVNVILQDAGGALFTLTFEGLKAEEAFNLVRKFDWEKIQKAAKSIK
ncbi:MAG: hypothetical protein JW786_10400 [Desulfobacterales bacterium]|nr:hypothetical protein [Desulfobacterales bacterium]